MEEIKLNDKLLAEFEGTEYWKELKSYFKKRAEKEMQEFFTKTFTIPQQMIDGYNEVKARIDVYDELIKKIDFVKMRVDREAKKGNKPV
jgi:hypothetical protein